MGHGSQLFCMCGISSFPVTCQSATGCAGHSKHLCNELLDPQSKRTLRTTLCGQPCCSDGDANTQRSDNRSITLVRGTLRQAGGTWHLGHAAAMARVCETTSLKVGHPFLYFPTWDLGPQSHHLSTRIWTQFLPHQDLGSGFIPYWDPGSGCPEVK